MDAKWSLARRLTAAEGRELDMFSPLEAQILFNRGLHTRAEAERFLRGESVDSSGDLPLMDMDAAVERILEAKEHKDRVAVYGDFDVDGLTATALMMEALESAGIKAVHHIPDRLAEGYGVNAAAVRSLNAMGVDLLITVDCGIRAIEEVNLARELGMDVVITDHHDPGQELPDAVGVLNPKRPGDPYQFKHLAGVGIAYKLARTLGIRLGMEDPSAGIDLVALGTVADVSPLLGVNRAWVRRGLERMNADSRTGIRALAEVAGIGNREITAQVIGFILGPRLNAAGRMGSADTGLQLLLSDERVEALRLAADLDRLNQQRRSETRTALDRARRVAFGQDFAHHLLFADDPNFSEGIAGLVAARMADEFYRPAIVARRGPNETRGSARSIPEVHITRALEQCAHLLSRYGGHAQAAGFRLPTAKLDRFKQDLARTVEAEIGAAALAPEIRIDALVELDELDDELLEFSGRLEPTGEGNPEPLFLAQRVRVVEPRLVGKQRRHLKLSLSQGSSFFDAIGFRLGERLSKLGNWVDVVFHYELNEFRGVQNKQLRVVDIQPAGYFQPGPN